MSYNSSKTLYLIYDQIDKIYDQIDGVSMGSPLAHHEKDCYHEKDWIENAQVTKATFYKRYVDEILVVFECELDAETFHAYFNIKHKNIKFTYEKQIDNKLPFLDILISNN